MELSTFADRDIDVHLMDVGVPTEAITTFHNVREPFEEAFATYLAKNEPEDIRDFLRKLTEFKKDYSKPRAEGERGRQVPFLKTQCVFRAFGKDRLGELRMYYLLCGQYEVETIQEIHHEMDPPKWVEVKEAYSCWLAAKFLLSEKRRKEGFLATEEGAATRSRFEDAILMEKETGRDRFRDRAGNGHKKLNPRQQNGWRKNIE